MGSFFQEWRINIYRGALIVRTPGPNRVNRGRYYGMSERSERGTLYFPSSNMTIKTIAMTFKTIEMTIIMTINTIVMTIKTIFRTMNSKYLEWLRAIENSATSYLEWLQACRDWHQISYNILGCQYLRDRIMHYLN
jgi:hypothetical protein